MKANGSRAIALLLGCFLGASAVVAEDGYLLVSPDEYAADLEAPDDDEFFDRAALDPLAPVIGILRPGTGREFKAPIDIELRFEAADGAEIDLGTLTITYGSLGFDVTERVTEHATITKDGLVSENAALPAGRHKLTVSIADTAGRVGKKRIKFRIVE